MEDIEDREPSSFLADNYKGITILVVDDDQLYLSRIKLILEAFSYEVITTTIPTIGLEMIQKDNERFQLVLANLDMNGMRKLSFLRILVQNSIPVVAIFRKRRENYFGNIIAEGAKYCMVKPNDWPYLKDIWQFANLKGRRPVAGKVVRPSVKKHKKHAVAVSARAPQSKDKGKGKEVEQEPEDKRKTKGKGKEVVNEPENKGKGKEVEQEPEDKSKSKGKEVVNESENKGKGKEVEQEPEDKSKSKGKKVVNELENKGKGKQVEQEPEDKSKSKGKGNEVANEPEKKGKGKRKEIVRAPTVNDNQLARESNVQVTVVGDNLVEWIAKPFKAGKGSGNIYDHSQYYYQIKAKYPRNKKACGSPPTDESTAKLLTNSGNFSTSSGVRTNAISDKNTIALQHVSAPLQNYGAAVKPLYEQQLGGSSSFGKSSTPLDEIFGVTPTQGSYQGQNAVQATNYSAFPNRQHIQVTGPTLSGHGGRKLGDIMSFSGNPSSLSQFNLRAPIPYATNLLHEPTTPTTFSGLISDSTFDWAGERSTTFPLVSITDAIYQNQSLMGTTSLNQPAISPQVSHQNNQRSDVSKFADPLAALFEQDPRQHTSANMWNMLEEHHSLPQDTNSPPLVTNRNQGSHPPVAPETSPFDANHQNEILYNVEPLTIEPIVPEDNSVVDYFAGVNMEDIAGWMNQ